MEKNNNKKMEELVSNRVVAMFAAGAILLWGLAYLYRLFDYIPTTQTAILVTKIITAAAAIGLLISVGLLFASIKKKTFDSAKIINPANLSGLFAVITACCGLLLYNYILGMKLIYVFIPAVVIYYLIYNVYQRAFFGLTVTHGLIAFILYMMSNSVKPWALYVYIGICVLICAAALAMCTIAYKKGGSYRVGKCKIRIFEKVNTAVLKSVIAIYGVTVLAVLASLLIPTYAIIYIFYAVIAFVVCCAVYYTIRLM